MSQSVVFFFWGPWPEGFAEWQRGDKVKPIVDAKAGLAVMYSHYHKGYTLAYRYFYRDASGSWTTLGEKYTPFGNGSWHWRVVDNPVSESELERRFQEAIGNKPKSQLKLKSAKQRRRGMSWGEKIALTKRLGLLHEPTQEALEFARIASLTEVETRPEQSRFRAEVFDNCDGACVVTGCRVPQALEAAHIIPHTDKGAAAVTNGLLLRADLHRIFDAGMMAINPADMSIHFTANAGGYEAYEGAKVITRNSVIGLASRWAAFAK